MNSPHRGLYIFYILLAACILLGQVCVIPYAEAARLGGGRSFGAKPSYQRSAPAPRPASPSQQQMSQSQQSTRSPVAGTPTRTPFGGMLGGLLAGSFLGYMLFGGHSTSAGIADILLLAFAAYIALKIFGFMRRRSTPAVAAGKTSYVAPDVVSPARPEPVAKTHLADQWQALRSTLASPAATGSQETSSSIPSDFDSADFLKGAKLFFSRLQQAWDKRDLDDIAQFTTPDMLREITIQAQADPKPSQTDILLINAELVSVSQEGADTIASVYFDVLMREDQREQASSQVKEIWHFIRPTAKESWRLEGIQQVQ